jgi:hypothetical protein
MSRLFAVLLLVALLPDAWADDPPGRVGRLAAIEGEVSVFADAELGWERAGINAHLTSENSVWTEPRSRAEVSVGSTALRLDEATQLDIVRLDDATLLAHVMRGSVAVRVRYFERDETLLLTTPSARFQIRGNGRYRVDVDADSGESLLAVFEGNARLEDAGGYASVDTGRALRVASGPRPSYAFENARDSAVDAWALARDALYREGQASRYVSPRMTGWEDLDAYGEWRNEPDYGVVWYPTRVAAGWAPYRYGRWTWVRPWGWTWVDDAPWGYAPFHYGRWVWVGSRWGWYPGRYVPRPVWAPALVGWVGGPGWSLSVSSGPRNVVGWYPLSPYDRYEPWYTARPTYVTNINNVVIVNRQPPRHHDNRGRGATVVDRDHFVSHKPVQNGITRVPADVIARQPVTPGSAVLPPRDDWRGRPRPAEGTAPPTGGGRPARPTFEAQKPVAPSAPSAQPATRPADLPMAPAAPSALPATRPMERPVAPTAPAAPPAARPAERPGVPSAPPSARPVERPPGAAVPPPAQVSPRPAEKPVAPSAPATQPGVRPVEKPVAPPSSRPVERAAPPAARPAEKPAAAPAPASARPVEKPAAPAGAPAAPAARPAEKPAAAQDGRPAGRGPDKPQ